MKKTSSSNPIVQRALDASQDRESDNELHSSKPIVERAILNRKLAKAKREWDAALFDILDNGRTPEKTAHLKECRAKYGEIWYALTGQKMLDRNGGAA